MSKATPKVIMRVLGYDGQIELMADRVVIRREGIINAIWFGFNSKKEIPLGAIAEIAYKDATSFKQGEIEFIRAGQTHNTKKMNFNKVKFPKKKNDEFEVLKEKVFELLNKLQNQNSK